MFMVTYIPTLWGFFYYVLDFKWLYPLTAFIRRLVNKANTGRFEKFIIEYGPDIVLSTHFLASEVISSLKRDRRLRARLVTCVTDFRMHSFWYSAETDLFCAGFAETKNDLTRKWKVAPQKIRVTGIPVHAKFYVARDRRAICQRRGLEEGLFTVLITGGGFGVGPITALVKNIVELKLRLQVLIVCGHNDKLKKQIDRFSVVGRGTACRAPTVNIKTFGFIDYVDELMGVSDLGITKAGGLICSESIAKGLPLVIIAPIPGQESRNCRLLLKNRAAFRIRRPAQLKKIVLAAYRNGEVLKNMRENIRAIKTQDPAMNIAGIALAEAAG
jgi:processive 1,2-diacylglycerol beta-glucosyltransferase